MEIAAKWCFCGVLHRRVQKIAQRLARALNVSGENLLLLLLLLLSLPLLLLLLTGRLLHVLLAYWQQQTSQMFPGVRVSLVLLREGLGFRV